MMIKQIFKWLKIVWVVLLVYLIAHHYLKKPNPKIFPTDKEMLAHFNQHRSEIERLVKLHREFDYLERVKPGSTPLNKAEQDTLMNKAGIQRIIGSSIGSSWYPDNYSEHTKHVLSSLYNRSSGNQATGQEIVETLRKEMPSLSKNSIPIVDFGQIHDLTQTMQIELADPRYEMFEGRKVYVHFPQSPWIQDNRIMVHDAFYKSLVARERIVASLDNPPADWQYGECLLKRVDMQWFMATCRIGVGSSS